MRQDSQKPAGRVERVVESIILVREEHVSGQLPGEERVHFLHARLDQRVSRTAILRNASELSHFLLERLGALHLDQNGRPGMRREDLSPVERHQDIAPHDLTAFVDHSETVGVAVERESDIRSVPANRFGKGEKVFAALRVRVMIREGPVGIAIERDDLAPQPFEILPDEEACRAVSCVRDNPEFPGAEADAREEHVDVVPTDRPRRDASGFPGVGKPAFGKTQDIPDLFAVHCGLPECELEPVHVLRVVAPGDHNCAVEVQLEKTPVEYRRHHHAEVGDGYARADEPAGRRSADPFGRKADVAADGRFVNAVLHEACAEGGAYLFHVFVGEIAVRDAADVVFPEDIGG